MKQCTIVGAGLAGSEACYQLAKRGYQVTLYEMRPHKMSPAHHSGDFAELVCSNSLRASAIHNAVGLLKAEMRLLDSLIMKAADATCVEAGGALAVDRERFAKYITDTLSALPNVHIIREEVKEIPTGPVIIASGPLTSDSLYNAIQNRLGEQELYFYDAVAPIVTAESLDYDKLFLASRYDKGEAAYLNAPFDKAEFERFYDYLIHADTVLPHDFEMKVFEGCMPIEDMAKRGQQTLLFGPMKPVGLINPQTGKRAYAVVQLRQDNSNKTLYNLVGFQTHLKYGAQDELLKLIPGLEQAKIVRYGVMHRNTYLHSPGILNTGYQLISNPDIFFAGQMTGVEGYVESAASGLVAGINMARYLANQTLLDLPNTTAIGSLGVHVANGDANNFVPMNVNFGIMPPYAVEGRIGKKERRDRQVQAALQIIEKLIGEMGLDEGCHE